MNKESYFVSLLRRYVDLEKSGSYLVGQCPFHKEEKLSFTVSELHQTWYCFGCGFGGDAASFKRTIVEYKTKELLK